MESVKGKIVLITGASSGIGASTAVLFAKYGARLALTGRNTANLVKVVEECCQCGVPEEQIIPITADLKIKDDIDRIVAETVQKFKGIDVLVNNAGIVKYCLLESVGVEHMEELFSVNVTAPVLLTKQALPFIKQSKGSIVNVSSLNGLRALAAQGVYSMTKAALDMFTSTLTLELRSSKVRVNSVCPGMIMTPIHNPKAPKEVLKEHLDNIASRYPADRIASPEEVANSIVFLASDAASFINGAKLPVDGGANVTTAWYQEEAKLLSDATKQ